MTESSTDPRTLARVTGLLYLVIIVTAGFAEGGVRAGVLAGGDPAATAAAIADSETFFRVGLLADLVAFLCDVAVSVLLYVLLRPAGRTLAMIAAAFRLVAHPAIGAVNLLHHFAALKIVTDLGPALGWDAATTAVASTFALEMHGYGYVLAGAFFGVHCALLGLLLVRSVRFPSWLGVLLVAAGAGYLFEVFAVFVAPSLTGAAGMVVVATAATGEVALCLYLLVRGMRPAAEERVA